MGGHLYSSDSHVRRSTLVSSKSFEDTFPQSKLRRIHESMNPKTIQLREARDSSINPVTYPIIFGMDVTGSMRKVPHSLIKGGLPKMVSTIIQRGVPSPSILFLAIGDSQAGDDAPLQVGQFENGDEQMDMWLQRTWPEGRGGGNAGESYLWAWYFAGNHCETDAWDKRKQKGLLVTFGDEPPLPTITQTEYKEVMGEYRPQLTFPLNAEDLLKKAKEKWDVYHINLSSHRLPDRQWREWLGENLLETSDYEEIPNIVADLAVKHLSTDKPVSTDKKSDDDIKITL